MTSDASLMLQFESRRDTLTLSSSSLPLDLLEADGTPRSDKRIRPLRPAARNDWEGSNEELLVLDSLDDAFQSRLSHLNQLFVELLLFSLRFCLNAPVYAL